MKSTKFNFLSLVCFILCPLVFMTSCKDDVPLEMGAYQYELHNGQTVASAPYAGTHPTDFTVDMELDELENGNTMISVTLNNTLDGETYHIHAHDAADPATTPNGTPYNEAPNDAIFAKMVEGNGSSVTITQETTMSYTELTTTYEGFFVVHDPLQAVNTADVSTYLVVGGFARAQAATNYQSSTYSYDFNTGQVLAIFGYIGTHENNLSASIQVDELADDASRITVRIMNSMDGQVYNTHAHDMANDSTTPNNTPYIETPNADVFAAAIAGNGATAAATNVSSMSYTDITTTYDGFFVVHDPLQPLSTVAPSTYVILGVFAR